MFSKRMLTNIGWQIIKNFNKYLSTEGVAFHNKIHRHHKEIQEEDARLHISMEGKAICKKERYTT